MDGKHKRGYFLPPNMDIPYTLPDDDTCVYVYPAVYSVLAPIISNLEAETIDTNGEAHGKHLVVT